jgi:exodeoxyribonuclease VII large subunit
MWRNQVIKLQELPREGDNIDIRGNVSVYESGGQYQFYATQIRYSGEGSLYKDFLTLKASLREEGLFDQSRKREVPKWPSRIGIITSSSGAALQDVINTINRRYPVVELFLSTSPVQGELAPSELRDSIQTMNQLVKPDLIILARGGGSIEDLWAFNSELLAREIANSEAPIICGIGHETDFTIADFVCDIRAPTPTAAAELATPNQSELKSKIHEYHNNLYQRLIISLSNRNQQLKTTYNKLSQQNQIARIQSNVQIVDVLLEKLHKTINKKNQSKRMQTEIMPQKIYSSNPNDILKRVYAIVSKFDWILAI